MSNVKFTNRTSYNVYVGATNGSSFILMPDSSVTMPNNESHILYSKAYYYKIMGIEIILPDFNHTDKVLEDNFIYEH